MVHKLQAVRALLHQHQLDALLIENPVDLFYLSGLNLSKGSLLIRKETTCLFVDGRYLAAAQKQSIFPVMPSEAGIFSKEGFIQGKVGFDSAWTSFDLYLKRQKDFPEIEWIGLSGMLKEIRVCKSLDEIAALKKAASLTREGIEHIKSLLREGVLEEELAFQFELFCRQKGASSLSFEPIVAFGEASAYPHYRAGKAALKQGQVVLIDVGAVVDHYRGDLTRVVFFGEVDPKLLKLAEIVKRAQRKAIEAVKPGLSLGKLDEIVREEFRKEGVEEYFTHSLGHGIGLETHEYPRVKWDAEDAFVLLKPGMVFTIEPGLYVPSLGGIRYEEMVVVAEHGHELC